LSLRIKIDPSSSGERVTDVTASAFDVTLLVLAPLSRTMGAKACEQMLQPASGEIDLDKALCNTKYAHASGALA
jgi:hypothetical protein